MTCYEISKQRHNKLYKCTLHFFLMIKQHQGLMVKMRVLLWFALHCLNVLVSLCRYDMSLGIRNIPLPAKIVWSFWVSCFVHSCMCVRVCVTQMKSEFTMSTQTQQSQKIKGWVLTDHKKLCFSSKVW